MIRRLLCGVRDNDRDKALRLLSEEGKIDPQIYELLSLLFPRVLYHLVLEYHCRELGAQLGLRVGRWKLGLRVGRWTNAYFGGDTRYFVNLVANHKGIIHSDNPMVQFPFEKKTICACPAFPSSSKVVKKNHDMKPDYGMIVNDNGSTLTIHFPSTLRDRNRKGEFAFETIGVRYRANHNTPWIPLFQLTRRHDGFVTDVSSNQITVYVDYATSTPQFPKISTINLTLNKNKTQKQVF